MIRKIGVALAITAGALAVTGVAAPAYAGKPGDGTINVGEVVLWKNTNFSGPLYDAPNALTSYPEGATPLTFVGDTTKVNDNVSSIANYDAANYVRAYVDYGPSGAFIQLLPYGVVSGTQSYAYSSLNATFNDNLSAHQVAGP